MKTAAQILVDCLVVNGTDRVYGDTVTETEQFAEIFAWAQSYSGPVLIEVKVA